MFDLHSHLLAGLDDGAKDIDEGISIARAAAADGVRLIAATPHVRDDYPTTPESMREALQTLRSALDASGVQVEIASGGELDLEFMRRLSPEDLRDFGLAGNPEALLVEFPYYGWPQNIDSVVISLRRKGFRTVLAHPERNAQVQDRPDRLEAAVRAGALLQITCQSLAGRAGRRAQRAAEALIASGATCLLATDTHSLDGSRTSLAEIRNLIGNDALADWLTVQVPAAITYGGKLPTRPALPASKRRAFRWLRSKTAEVHQ